MIQIRSVTGFCDPDGGTQGGAISPHQLKHATLVDLSIPVEVDLFLTGGGIHLPIDRNTLPLPVTLYLPDIAVPSWHSATSFLLENNRHDEYMRYIAVSLSPISLSRMFSLLLCVLVLRIYYDSNP